MPRYYTVPDVVSQYYPELIDDYIRAAQGAYSKPEYDPWATAFGSFAQGIGSQYDAYLNENMKRRSEQRAYEDKINFDQAHQDQLKEREQAKLSLEAQYKDQKDKEYREAFQRYRQQAGGIGGEDIPQPRPQQFAESPYIQPDVQTPYQLGMGPNATQQGPMPTRTRSTGLEFWKNLAATDPGLYAWAAQKTGAAAELNKLVYAPDSQMTERLNILERAAKDGTWTPELHNALLPGVPAFQMAPEDPGKGWERRRNAYADANPDKAGMIFGGETKRAPYNEEYSRWLIRAGASTDQINSGTVPMDIMEKADKLQLNFENQKTTNRITLQNQGTYDKKNPSLTGLVFDEYGHPIKQAVSQEDIDQNHYLVLRSPADRQVIGSFAMIESPLRALNNAIEKGVLPQATGGSVYDAASAYLSGVTGGPKTFSDPDYAKFASAQQNILFPILGLEGSGKRVAIQELTQRMKANPGWVDTDLSAAAKADQLAEIIEARANASGVLLTPEMQAEVDRAHRLAAQVQARVGGGAPTSPSGWLQKTLGGLFGGGASRSGLSPEKEARRQELLRKDRGQ